MDLDDLPFASIMAAGSGLYISLMSYGSLNSNPQIAPIGLFIGGVFLGLSPSFVNLD